MRSSYHKPKVKYVPKSKTFNVEEKTVDEIQRAVELRADNELNETLSKEVISEELKLIEEESLDNSQLTLEEKSDDATSAPDEESPDLPLLLEIELLTTNGTKLIQIHYGDDVAEVINRIARENDLSRQVKEAIEYKITKAINETERMHNI